MAGGRRSPPGSALLLLLALALGDARGSGRSISFQNGGGRLSGGLPGQKVPGPPSHMPAGVTGRDMSLGGGVAPPRSAAPRPGKPFALPARQPARSKASLPPMPAQKAPEEACSSPPRAFALPARARALSKEATGRMSAELESRASMLQDKLESCKGFFDEVAAKATGGPPPSAPQGRKYAAFIDLDNTAIYGQDGNDLGVGFQLAEKSDLLTELYEKLSNPKLTELMDGIREQGLADDVKVCLYTRRSHLLKYQTKFRSEPVPISFSHVSWHHSQDQVVIPGDVATSEELIQACDSDEFLAPSELRDLRLSFDRLLAARNALQRVLNLSRPLDVVVTSAVKDVRETARKMGLQPERSVLWDDNEDLRGAPGVEVVDRFDRMPPKQCRELLNFLEKKLPATELPRKAVDFMLGASKDATSVERRADNSVAYKVLEGPAPRPFRLPSFFLGKPSSSSPTSVGGTAKSCTAAKAQPSDLEQAWQRVPAQAQEALAAVEQAVRNVPVDGLNRVATAVRQSSMFLTDPLSLSRAGVGEPLAVVDSKSFGALEEPRDPVGFPKEGWCSAGNGGGWG
mmetsp:Transcript_29938/g.73665  ORF Transcript_29938/g.73665 Transcript_29938/m.73665 type:complete len:571 (-) Transcript_29938:223-1935(-)